MVARIKSSKNIARALNYNEQKLRSRAALILHAEGFLKDAGKLSFQEKLVTFEKLTSLNERTTTNALHVSLSFHPSEALEKEILIAISKAYMEGIGFSDQPYLVYQHFDSGHPHIHIVTTNIQWDGSRISLHNLGRNASERTRKRLEREFGLVMAEGQKEREQYSIQPLSAERVKYGKNAAKAAISSVLRVVIEGYHFSSLEQLNAVLSLYRVVAERGSEGSRMQKWGGLTYRILDERGEKVGKPIKASAFFFKPTLANLSQKFGEGQRSKQPHAGRLKSIIDFTFSKKKPECPSAFTQALKKEGISVVLRKTKDDLVYGVTYVDHKSKCVFNGSELGKAYSAKMIQEKCAESGIPALASQFSKMTAAPLPKAKTEPKENPARLPIRTVLEAGNEPGVDPVPKDLKKKGKKNRRRINL